MTRLAVEARKFWSAAYFYRRAKGRDRRVALIIIRDLTKSPLPRIASLAVSMMEEIREPTRNN